MVEILIFCMFLAPLNSRPDGTKSRFSNGLLPSLLELLGNILNNQFSSIGINSS